MRREQDPQVPSHLVGEQVVDIVEDLVGLWFSAVEEVRPRLPPRQIRALRAVRRRPALNLTGLAEHLRVGLPTASRLCDRLEAAGLLRRGVRPDDRREVSLEVTDAGRVFLADITELLSLRLATALDEAPPTGRARLEQTLHVFDDEAPADATEPDTEAFTER
ncbi:MarR family winged helix-turn-helix transcriptional regulator [Streptomyces sp. NPDC093568]|uniref:MarR family winged helix-turn-helix transcriptional regulator n=1 Tax=Streptomyces sp. NPDC093568 TaxID=3366041 RepID=UPI003814BC2A